MKKRTLKPGTMLNPLPVVMVSCGSGETSNLITVAWTGIVNSEPPMTYVSVKKTRHSHDLIEKNGEFVINLVNHELVKACDFCGVRSGRNLDKWKETGLTPIPASVVSSDMILESPVNLECRVHETHSYPSHDMFVAEIVSVHVDESLINGAGKICLEDADLIVYNHGAYMPVQKKILGTFGFSVMKPKTQKRKAAERRRKSRMSRPKKG